MHKISHVSLVLIPCVAWIVSSCTSFPPLTSPTPTASPTPTQSPTPTESELICADGGVYVMVWEDLNSDGDHDAVEPPLEGVCIWADYGSPNTAWIKEQCKNKENSEFFTGSDGTWSSTFMIGGCGSREEVEEQMDQQCESIIVYALPPDGYVPTESQMPGCMAGFVFAKGDQVTPMPPEATPTH